MLLPENLCNQSPGFGALVILEDTPYPLPVGCLTDSLPELTRQYRVVVAPRGGLILLLSSTGGPALPGRPFRLSIPHQARMETPLPEVHPPGDPCLHLLFPMEAHCLCKNDVGKEDGSLRVTSPSENPLPFRSQYGCEAVPYCARGRGIPAS